MPVLWASASSIAFLMAIVAIYGLGSSLFGPPPTFRPAAPADWLTAASAEYAVDYAVHVMSMTFIVFGLAILFPALGRRPTTTLLGSLAISGAWTLVGFNWYEPPRGVVTDGMDDILMVASVFIAALHCGIAAVARGPRRFRSIAAACAVGAVIIETGMLHALVILPAARAYDQQAQWLARALDRPETRPLLLCRARGLVCLGAENGKVAQIEGTRFPGMPDVVVERAIEVTEKFGIFQQPRSRSARIWIMRHRGLEHFTGSFRIPAVETDDGGRRIVLVDMSLAPIANLWLRSFTHLHLLCLCVVWMAMIPLITSVHGRRRP